MYYRVVYSTLLPSTDGDFTKVVEVHSRVGPDIHAITLIAVGGVLKRNKLPAISGPAILGIGIDPKPPVVSFIGRVFGDKAVDGVARMVDDDHGWKVG